MSGVNRFVRSVNGILKVERFCGRMIYVLAIDRDANIL